MAATWLARLQRSLMVCGWKPNTRVFNLAKKIEFSDLIPDVVFTALAPFAAGTIEGHGHDRDLLPGLQWHPCRIRWGLAYLGEFISIFAPGQ